VANWYKLLIKTLSALKTIFTQCFRDALTVTWNMRHFRHFTSEHYKVSKSEAFEKVILAANFRISADDMCKQELSYRQQIARQLRTQYVDGIYDNPVTLKSRPTVTQGH